jgi:ABC-type sugar transport system ATPase subunit
MTTNLFEMSGILKRFGGVVALDDVDFAVAPDEVMARFVQSRRPGYELRP